MRCRSAVGALAVLMTGTALALVPAGAAGAHPLGNFTVSQYDGIVVSPGRLRVDHVEDLAEIPAAQELSRIDTDGDGRPAEAELSAWARTRCDVAARGARLVVGGGERTTVTAGRARAEERPGQAGLKTLRVTCELTAPLARGEDIRIAYRPADASTVGGWREITGRGDAMTLHGSDVPQRSVSRRLSTYPNDLLSSPPERTAAAFTVRSGGPALADGGSEASRNGSPAAGVLPRGADRWAEALTGLVARHELTVGFAAFALVVALCLGALHALAPGHGKTMMAAAATAGGRTSLRDVLTLGASVTLTHTLGVFALGALITAGSAAAPTVVSWLTVASGGLVAVAGLLLVRRAWRRRREPHDHGHGHRHELGHDRKQLDAPAQAAGCTDAPAAERVPALAAAGAGHAAAVSPSAAAPVPAGTGHHHDGDRGQGEPCRHEHDEQQGHQRHRSSDTHGHRHGHDHHGHGHHHAHGHSHVPPAPGLRGVVLMGLAGGLVPSPSAVVVLVGAAALGQAWFGFLLIVAYGAGLALTLAAAGFAVVRLRETTTRRLALRPHGPLFSLVGRTAPMASAVVVLTLGCGLLLRGVATALG
ncbi:nickel transporter [Streptomyces xantholiticus]